MRLVGTVIRSRNVGRQMAVVETWMEVRRLAFSRCTWSKRSRDKTPPSQNVADSDKTYPGVGQNVPAC